MSTPENPPLFHPSPGDTAYTEVTLRDLFAAFAMAGFIGRMNPKEEPLLAPAAYRAADAMLEARSR